MKKLIKISILILMLGKLVVESDAQVDLNDISLITWEYVPGRNVIRKKPKLVRYSFSDGKLISREEIYRVGNSTPRYFDGSSSILNNRYVISQFGNIFDLQNEKLLFTHIGFDYPVEVVNDKIIYKHRPYSHYFDKEDSIRHSRIGSLYYYFDLETEELIEFDQGVKYRVEGELSKNKELGLEFIHESRYYHQIDSLEPSELVSYRAGKLVLNAFEAVPTVVLDSLSVGVNYRSSFQNELPVLWVDNENFLTQLRNGELILANLHSEIQSFPILTNLKNELRSPSLYVSSNGNIIYHCPTLQSDKYVVNVDELNLIKLSDVIDVNEGFSFSWDGALTVWFNGEQVLSDSSMTLQYATYNNLIATQSFEDCETDKWKCNTLITIYDSSGELLESIETRYVHSIIGWVVN